MAVHPTTVVVLVETICNPASMVVTTLKDCIVPCPLLVILIVLSTVPLTGKFEAEGVT